MVHLHIDRIDARPAQGHVDQALAKAPELGRFLLAHQLAHR